MLSSTQARARTPADCGCCAPGKRGPTFVMQLLLLAFTVFITIVYMPEPAPALAPSVAAPNQEGGPPQFPPLQLSRGASNINTFKHVQRAVNAFRITVNQGNGSTMSSMIAILSFTVITHVIIWPTSCPQSAWLWHTPSAPSPHYGQQQNCD